MDIYLWGMTAAENIESVPDGAPEGWRWTRVAETSREAMAASRRWYENPEWIRLVTDPVFRADATTFRVLGEDVTAAFPAGSRLRMVAGGVVVDGTIVSAVLDAGDTLVTITDAEVPVGIEYVLLHSYGSWASAAFEEVGPETGKLAIVDDVILTGEETVAIDNATLGRVLSVEHRVIRVWGPSGTTWLALPDADGVTNHYLCLRLRLDTENTGLLLNLPAMQFEVHVGPSGTESDLTVYSFPVGAINMLATTEIVSIPAIPLGTPVVGSRVSVYGYMTSPIPETACTVSDSGDFTGHHVRRLR